MSDRYITKHDHDIIVKHALEMGNNSQAALIREAREIIEYHINNDPDDKHYMDRFEKIYNWLEKTKEI